MKNKLLIVMALSWCTVTFGQIAGVKVIPGDYATIAAAVADLNTSGVGTGGVTFYVSSGYTEDITSPLLITATGTSGNPIVFQANSEPLMLPSTANPLIRRTDAGTVATTILEAQGDGVIILDGSDYITFDGIDVQATDQGIEYGYYLRRASATDGCKNVTIKNAAITMTKGTSAFVIGIFASPNDASSLPSSATGITVTSIGGRAENLVITGNTISNVLGGIDIRGYNHAAPYDFMDQNNVIGGAANTGNTIRNFGGTSTANCFGVHLFYQTSPNISYNIIDNVAGGGTDATGSIYGIWHQLSNNVGNFVASNNTFVLGENASSGGTVTGIQATPAGTTDNTIVIQNNTFTMGTFNCTGTSYLINCSGAKANNITVTGNSIVGTVTKTGASGVFYGYDNTGGGASTGGTQTISNNNFSNVTVGGTGIFYGIEARSNSNLLQTVVITNNIVSNITAGGSVKGIYQSGGAAGSTVNNNVISGLFNTGAATTGNNAISGIMLGSNSAPAGITAYNNTISNLRGTESVYGFWNNNGANNKIYQNTISNVRNNATGIGPVYGIIVNGGISTTIYNNFISDLTAPYANGLYPVMGIYIAAGTSVNMYYNTIYLNATSTGTLFGTVGIYAKTNTILDLRNNIVINTSTHAGDGGYTVAYRRYDPYLGSYAATADNNDFYVSSNLNYGNYIFCDGNSSALATLKDSTMADYKARVAPRDAASFGEIPPFVNVATVPYDLHIQPLIATLCESGGARVTSPFPITNDLDSDLRWGETGYPGTGTAPDVGADEFGYIPISLAAQGVSALCPTSNDGSINLTVSGGIAPFTYLWSNSATTEDLTGLAPGTYTVQVTDVTGAHLGGSWNVGQVGLICNNSTVSGEISNTQCYNAYQTLTISDMAVTAPNGHVELIAGQHILFLPGTSVQEGAWLWGHISTTYCSPIVPPMVATGEGQEVQPAGLSTASFSLYPNPASGNITLLQKGDRNFTHVTVEIFNMSGNRILTDRMAGEKQHEFATSVLPSGIYFVRVVAEDYVETIKLVKTR